MYHHQHRTSRETTQWDNSCQKPKLLHDDMMTLMMMGNSSKKTNYIRLNAKPTSQELWCKCKCLCECSNNKNNSLETKYMRVTFIFINRILFFLLLFYVENTELSRQEARSNIGIPSLTHHRCHYLIGSEKKAKNKYLFHSWFCCWKPTNSAYNAISILSQFR